MVVKRAGVLVSWVAYALLAATGCAGQEAAPVDRSSTGGVPDPTAESALRLDGNNPRDPAGGGEGATEIASTDRGASAVLRLTSHLFVERDVAVQTRRFGIVRTVGAQRGDRVSGGDILCELESQDLSLALEVARINADRARAAFERAKQLHGDNLISVQEYENAEYSSRSADREAEIAAFELEKSFVRAPFEGIVSARNVEVGQVLVEDDTRVLFRVTAMEPLLARLYVPQWAWAHLRRGDPVELTASAAAGDVVEGRIRWINDVLDAASASAEVLAEIPKASRSSLRPGMGVTAELAIRLLPGRLTVPRAAFRPSPGEPSEGELTVLGPGGPEPRRARAGFLGDDRIEILSGLQAGERVVLPSPGAIRDSGAVR